MTENHKTSSDGKRHPVEMPLFEWICRWREEIRSKSPPGPRGLEEVMRLADNAGVDREFFLYVVGGCEWYFRIHPRPGSVVLRKKLKAKLATRGYSPFGYPGPMPVSRDPTFDDLSLVGRYVDHRLAELWDGKRSEASRFRLEGDLKRLVRRLDTPFLAATLDSVPPKRGGYASLSAWVAAAMIYARVRETHPNRQDPVPKDIALDLVCALRGRDAESSQFHARRRLIAKRMPDLYDLFVSGLSNVTEAHRVSVEKIFEGAMEPGLAWYGLVREGFRLFRGGSKRDQKPMPTQQRKDQYFEVASEDN